MSATAWFEGFFFALVRASWQASVLILLVLAVRWLFRKALPAQWRFWFWALVFIRLALPVSLPSPVSIFNFSHLNVPSTLISPAAEVNSVPYQEPVRAPAPQSFDRAAERPATFPSGSPAPASAPAETSSFSLRGLLPFLWGLGVLLLTLRVILAHRRLAKRLAGEAPSRDPALRDLVASCAREVGLRRPPLAYETAAVNCPGVFGVFSPRLLLPVPAISTLTPFQLRCVVLHEICHLRRRDVCLNWLTTALQILHWINPLVWLAASRSRTDRELACDALTLGHLGQGETRAYGNTLLCLIENCAARTRVPGMAAIGDGLGHLKFRLAMISRFSTRPLRWTFLGIAIALLLAVVTLTDGQAPSAAPGMHVDLFMLQGCTSAHPVCACEPSPAVAAAIEKATPNGFDSADSPGERQRKIRELQALIRQYPREVAVHLAYQRAVETAQRLERQTAGVTVDTLKMEYGGLAQQHPDDALYQYLYGQFLVGRDRAEARRTLQLSLEKDPAFPWAHLALGRLDYMEGKKDDQVRHLRAFLDKCPCNLEAYSMIVGAEPAAQALQDLAKMRVVLRQKPALLLGAYLSLWDNELELTPIPDQPKVRREIAGDLVGVRNLQRTDLPMWWTILEEGYKRAWDSKGLAWARSGRELQLKGTPLGFQAARQNWLNNHSYVRDNQAKQERDAYVNARLEASAGWVKQWPDDLAAWMERISTLKMATGDRAAEINYAYDNMLKVLDQSIGKNPAVVSSLAYLQVASNYLDRGDRIDQVPGLVDKAIKASGATSGSSPIDLIPVNTRWRAWQLSADAFLGMKQVDKVRPILAEMETFISKNRDALAAASWESDLKYYQGKLAAAQKRPAEAINLYQSVLRYRAERGSLYYSPISATQSTDPLIATTAALWKELGRPDSGWQAFLKELDGIRAARAQKAAPKWQDANTPLPDFSLADARGKIWRLSDLKGKTVVINVWAVWSSKYNQNMKMIQDLYDRLKERPDVLFLTFNADQYTPQIEPFLKEGNYTMPVIPAHRYVQSFKPFSGQGQTWIVDRDGTIRKELKGNIAGADALAETISQIDQVSKAR